MESLGCTRKLSLGSEADVQQQACSEVGGEIKCVGSKQTANVLSDIFDWGFLELSTMSDSWFLKYQSNNSVQC